MYAVGRVFIMHAEDHAVVKTDSESFTVKRTEVGVTSTGPRK